MSWAEAMKASLRGPGEWIIPDWNAPPQVKAFVTTRHGGVSTGAYASMNLGTRSGDDPTHVARNRRIVHDLLPSTPRWMAQTHGTSVADLDRLGAAQLHRQVCGSLNVSVLLAKRERSLQLIDTRLELTQPHRCLRQPLDIVRIQRRVYVAPLACAQASARVEIDPTLALRQLRQVHAAHAVTLLHHGRYQQMVAQHELVVVLQALRVVREIEKRRTNDGHVALGCPLKALPEIRHEPVAQANGIQHLFGHFRVHPWQVADVT